MKNNQTKKILIDICISPETDEVDITELYGEVEREAKVNFAIKQLQEIIDYVNSWEESLSLNRSDYDIVCLKAYVQAKIDVLKKERDKINEN